MPDPRNARATQTPIAGRSFIVGACAAFAVAGPAAVQAQSLTESDVIERVRAHDPDVAAADAAAVLADAAEIEAGLYPNPELAWEREHLPGLEAEDAITLSVPIDLSGRRAARGALARADAREARVSAARSRSAAVVRALLLFYEAISADRRAAIARESLAQLDEAARVLGRRLEEGTASGYETTRLELEAELARSRSREAEAEAAAARRQLAERLAIEGEPELRGELVPAGGAASEAVRRPSLALAELAVAEARQARDDAGSAWVPALTIEGGLRIGTGDQTRFGYVAGVSLALPIFSRGQELTARAEATAQLLAARAEALRRADRVAAVRARAELALARAELTRFEEATAERVERLQTAAAGGYREGRRTIVELLDAQRARTAVELRRLELAEAARRADIRLRAARGELE